MTEPTHPTAHPASPEEREEVLDLVFAWLDHWGDTLSEPDAGEHLGDFVTSITDLLETMLKTMAKHGPIDDEGFDTVIPLNTTLQ